MHRNPGRDRRAAATTAAALALLALAVLGLGCTSDDPNAVGTGFQPLIDLDEPTVFKTTILADFGTVAVRDQDTPFDQSEVLYFGRTETGGEASSILASYDFSGLLDSTDVISEVTAASIVSVELRLFRLKAYASQLLPDGTTGEREYELWNLPEPLDVSLYPGPEPDFQPGDFIVSEMGSGSAIFLEIPEGDFQDWYDGGGTADIAIREGEDSDPGIVGYASRELELFTQLELEIEGTVVGPIITVTVTDGDPEDPQIDAVTFVPTADVSTFHQLDAEPATPDDGFFLRTHLRCYPWFRFDLSGLPQGPELLINRAVLRCALDTTAGYGSPESLVFSEIPLSAVAGVDTIDLADLEDAATVVAGLTTVRPDTLQGDVGTWIGVPLTSTIQRYRNGVLGDDTALIMTAGEDAFSTYDTTIWDPEFYLTRYQFIGTDDPVLRPELEITYTIFSGGVQ